MGVCAARRAAAVRGSAGGGVLSTGGEAGAALSPAVDTTMRRGVSAATSGSGSDAWVVQRQIGTWRKEGEGRVNLGAAVSVSRSP